MKIYVIACSIMKEELTRFQTPEITFDFLEQSLHRTPAQLKQRVQEALVRAEESDRDMVLLSYGLCSNGIAGVKTRRLPLVIPRVHDCIALFLGSVERHQAEHQKEPGTYYLTRGWIEEGKSPLGVIEEYCQRFPRATAEWVMREELKNYTRIALVETGLGVEEKHRDHARENARFFNLRYEEIKGSLDLFKRMLGGEWKKDFLFLQPGEEVSLEMFL